MDLRQLRYFKVLAIHQHFGRAAAFLHIAQPALSRQIQSLESELGIQLVERRSRGASLTREGELLLERSTFLLHYTDQIKVDIIDLQGTPRGPVTLGLPPALASVMVPPLARVLRERYRDIRLRVIESFSPVLCDALEQGTVDIAVLSGPIVARPLIHMEPLLTEQVCAIGPADDVRLRAHSLTVRQLDSVPLILTGLQNYGIRLALERATAQENIHLDGVMEVESATVAAQLVKDGAGWTIHFASAVSRDIEAGVLRAVPVNGIKLERYLAYTTTRPPSAATVSLVSLMYATAQTLIATKQWPMAEMSVNDDQADRDVD
jgi:LysR family nitrogen assimilation transcriptional regulator